MDASVLESAIRQIVREEMALRFPAAPSTDDKETVTGAAMAREYGFSTDAIAIWCNRGLIAGAFRPGTRGHWRFTRRAWEEFMAGKTRRPRAKRSQLRSAA